MNGQVRRTTLIDGLIIALVLGAFLAQSLYTMRQVGPCWDEPVYFHSAKNYYHWFANLGNPAALSREVRRQVFGMALMTDCNPTLPKLLGTVTYALFKNAMGKFYAYRLYSPVLFGLLLALIYYRAQKSWGRFAALCATLSVGLLPRLFTDAHIGATETALCFFWFLTVLLFEASFRNRKLIPLAGVSFGLAMSVKFTGFLLPIPLLLWAAVFERSRMFRPALGLFLIGPVVFFLLEPSMWDQPISGLRQFLEFSLHREHKVVVATLFLGKYYDFSAPWYYSPFMVLVTTPAIVLLGFGLGILRSAFSKLSDPPAVSSLIHFGFFILIMMAPNAPTYDGVRLFDPAFVFLGLLAGFGLDGTLQAIGKRIRLRPVLLRAGVLALLAAGAGHQLFKVYPYGLEYYNELIGGVSGANRRGMETTYWWTVVNKKAVARINHALPPNARLACVLDSQMAEFYRELGWLRKDIVPTQQMNFDHVLMLSRIYYKDLSFSESLIGLKPELEFETQGPIQAPDGHIELTRQVMKLKLLDYETLDQVPLWRLYRKAND